MLNLELKISKGNLYIANVSAREDIGEYKKGEEVMVNIQPLTDVNYVNIKTKKEVNRKDNRVCIYTVPGKHSARYIVMEDIKELDGKFEILSLNTFQSQI